MSSIPTTDISAGIRISCSKKCRHHSQCDQIIHGEHGSRTRLHGQSVRCSNVTKLSEIGIIMWALLNFEWVKRHVG